MLKIFARWMCLFLCLLSMAPPLAALASSQGRVLLVARGAVLGENDQVVKDRLEALGFEVVIVAAKDATDDDAEGVDLVAISASAPSAEVSTKFAKVEIPVLVWEPSVFDDMGMTGPVAGVDFGFAKSQTTLDIVTGESALAAGLVGEVSVTSIPRRFSWGSPSSDAIVVATLADDPSRSAIFAYETGSVMPGLVAPARRVGLFLNEQTATALTSEGLALFDAAVRWASGRTAPLGTTEVALTSPIAGAKFSVGEPIELRAAATGEQGIARVDFLVLETTVGASSAAPHGFELTAGLDEGVYTLRARAIDTRGRETLSSPVAITVGVPEREVLFVIDDTKAPSPGDTAARLRLEEMGYLVEMRSAADVATPTVAQGLAAGKALVVLSATVSESETAVALRQVAVPAVSWAASLYGELGLTGTTAGVEFGRLEPGSDIDFLVPPTFLGLDIDGSPLLVSTPQRLGFGVPTNTASLAALARGGFEEVAVFGYEAGVQMASGVAPARRVALPFAADTPAFLTSIGWRLFDSAITWAAGFTAPLAGDVLPPTITIVSPVGLVVGDSAPSLIVDYGDSDSGIDPVTVRIEVDGVDITASCVVGSSSASCTPTLAAGTHQIRAEVSDLAGNTAADLADIDILLDATPPTVTIAQPLAGGLVNVDRIVVSGTVSDDDVVTRVEINGREASLDAAGTFSREVRLAAGVSTLRAVAIDRAGNLGSAEVTLTSDTTSPFLRLDAPTAMRTHAASARVAGRVDDASGVATLTVADVPVAVSQGAFELTVDLAEGLNVLPVRAVDNAGNSSELTVQIERLTLPSLTILEPADRSSVVGDTITVTGTVSDPAASVKINGVAATVSGTSFTADVPVVVGGNLIDVVAMLPNGLAAPTTITVFRDATPPRVAIRTPVDGAVLFDSTVNVAGLVNDIVLGTVNAEQATVTVNGQPATVSNRGFLATVDLVPGANEVRVIATDANGLQGEASVQVQFESLAEAAIRRHAGDLQVAEIATALPQPLAARLTDAAGLPVAGRPVVFEVATGSGHFDNGRRRIVANSDAAGLAAANFTLGSHAGAGAQAVAASAVGFFGQAEFSFIVEPAPPSRLLVDSGDQQVGIAGQPTPNPFVAVVTDSGFNRLADVPVRFEIVEGQGVFADGTTETVVRSDSDGRVSAVLRLDSEEGVANNVVQARLVDDPELTLASFVASGRTAGDPASTSISGLVLDNTDQPIAGVTVFVAGSDTSVSTAEDGSFRIPGAPVGTFLLEVDGSTAERPGTWPHLEFVMTTVPGRDNTVGMPIYLLPLDVEGGVFVSEDQGGVVTLPSVEGFALDIAAGSATFPDGSRSGVVSVTAVHSDKVPMPPNFGQQPRLIVTIQPSGTVFDPPARLILPNTDGLAPGEVTEFYSFDHDLASFVSVGPATVSGDGTVVVSNVGAGVVKAGWHCGGDPTGAGTPHACPTCQRCVGDRCVADLNRNGSACDDSDVCTLNDQCDNGICEGEPLELDRVTAQANGENEAIVMAGEEPVTFTVEVGGSASECTDLQYAWSFGDGETSDLESPSHTYAEPGVFTVTVTVRCGECPVEGSAAVTVRAVVIEIFEINTPGDEAMPAADNSFVASADEIEVKARVLGSPELASRIEWRAEAVGNHTGAADPETASQTDTFAFRAASNQPTDGSRMANPALEYRVTARLSDNESITDEVEPLAVIRQDETDILRQEYVDYDNSVKPTRDQVSTPANPVLNKGNYTVIAEDTAGELATLLNAVEVQLNALLNNDEQVIQPGECATPEIGNECLAVPTAVVVRPGPGFDTEVRVGTVPPLADTDPEGDDVCATELRFGFCTSEILAGPNGIAETRANNRGVQIDLDNAVTSAFRNPQRNRAIGSKFINSKHVEGKALDIDPDLFPFVPGKSRDELFCYLERAAELVPTVGSSVTECGAACFVQCTTLTTTKTIVHIQNR